MNMVVLDGFAVNPGDISWDCIKKRGNLTVYEQSEQWEVAEKCKEAEAVFVNRTKMTADTMSRCPGLKFINTLGTGYDMIDLDYCREHGIIVCNIPAYSSNSVAQMVFSMLLALTTDIESFRSAPKNGRWTGMADYNFQEFKHIELSGLTIGLVGCGGIGRRVAEIAVSFGMNVMATTTSRTEGYENGIKYMKLDEMLNISDVVSIHCPLTDKTRGMADESFFSKMKDGAVFINTARGKIVNEKALYEAMKSGKVSGAGLDVMADEPPCPDNPLLNLKNCIITPHISWATKAARQRLLSILDDNLEAFQKGSELKNRVI